MNYPTESNRFKYHGEDKIENPDTQEKDKERAVRPKEDQRSAISGQFAQQNVTNKQGQNTALWDSLNGPEAQWTDDPVHHHGPLLPNWQALGDPQQTQVEQRYKNLPQSQTPFLPTQLLIIRAKFTASAEGGLDPTITILRRDLS